MQNKKAQKTKTPWEIQMEARKAFAEWNRQRQEEAEMYPINWDNFGTDRPTVEKKSK